MSEVLIVLGLLVVVIIAVIVIIICQIRASSHRRALAADDRNQVAFERWLDLQPTDAERQMALSHLDEAFATGQIDQAEHTERVTAILEARTNRETEHALNDLRSPDVV
jgi:hypothetical protein